MEKREGDIRDSEKENLVSVKTTEDKEKIEKNDQKQLKILSDDQVDVDIDPNVKSNDIKIQFCSCSIIFYCFSPR